MQHNIPVKPEYLNNKGDGGVIPRGHKKFESKDNKIKVNV